MTNTEGLLATKSSKVLSDRCTTSLGTSLHSSSFGGGVAGAGLHRDTKRTIITTSWTKVLGTVIQYTYSSLFPPYTMLKLGKTFG